MEGLGLQTKGRMNISRGKCRPRKTTNGHLTDFRCPIKPWHQVWRDFVFGYIGGWPQITDSKNRFCFAHLIPRKGHIQKSVKIQSKSTRKRGAALRTKMLSGFCIDIRQDNHKQRQKDDPLVSKKGWSERVTEFKDLWTNLQGLRA